MQRDRHRDRWIEMMEMEIGRESSRYTERGRSTQIYTHWSDIGEEAQVLAAGKYYMIS